MSYDFHIIEHIKKARLRHICDETRAVINPGDSYVKIAGKYDGDFYSHKLCAEIYPIWDRWNDRRWKLNREGITFGELCEEMDQTLEDSDSPDPQDLEDALTFCRLWNGGKECYLAKTIQEITKS
jgi:hypothetical protein